MTSPQDVEVSVITNSPSEDSFHPDNQIPSKDKCKIKLSYLLIDDH